MASRCRNMLQLVYILNGVSRRAFLDDILITYTSFVHLCKWSLVDDSIQAAVSCFFRQSFPDYLSSSDWVVSCSLKYNRVPILCLCYSWRIERKCNDYLLHFFPMSYYWIYFTILSPYNFNNARMYF
jgi:hypothetical protein